MTVTSPEPSPSPELADRGFSPDLSQYFAGMGGLRDPVHGAPLMSSPLMSSPPAADPVSSGTTSASSSDGVSAWSHVAMLSDTITESDMARSPEAPGIVRQPLSPLSAEPSASPPAPSPAASPIEGGRGGSRAPPSIMREIEVAEAMAAQGELHAPWPPPSASSAAPSTLLARRLSRSSSQVAAELAGSGNLGSSSSPPVMHRILSASERKPLYASRNPKVKFVSSYAAAVSGCMSQSQLAARDPALIGKLLSFFIANFIRKYWLYVLVITGAVLAVQLTGHTRWFVYTPAVVALWLLFKLMLIRSRITVELKPGVPLRAFHFFKHPRLLLRAKQLPVARMYSSTAFLQQPGYGAIGSNTPGTPGTPSGPSALASSPAGSGGSAGAAEIFFQPSEGYCGQASLNNVLASIPLHPSPLSLTRRFFASLPAVVRPFTLHELAEYFKDLVRSNSGGVLEANIEKIECMHSWERKEEHGASASASAAVTGASVPSDISPSTPSAPGGYASFLAMIQTQVNDPQYRFMVNFLRTPIFFCEEDKRALAAAAAAASAASAGGATHSTHPVASGVAASPSVSPPASAAPVVAPSVASAPPVSLGRKLFSGHWSPLIGYLSPEEVERVMFRGGSATPQMGGGAGALSYPPSPGSGPVHHPVKAGAGPAAIHRGSPLRAASSHFAGLGSSAAPNTGNAIGAAAFTPGSPIQEGLDSSSNFDLASGHAPSSSSSAAVSPAASKGSEGTGGSVVTAATVVASVAALDPILSSTSAAEQTAASAQTPAESVASIVATAAAEQASSSSASASAATGLRCRSAAGSGGGSHVSVQPRSTSDAVQHYASSLGLGSPWGVASAFSTLPYHPSERASLSEGLCLVADVNPSYAHYLLPPRRLFEAINTINVMDGGPRGIVRVTLKKHEGTATVAASSQGALAN